jgi:hypothetical protein
VPHDKYITLHITLYLAVFRSTFVTFFWWQILAGGRLAHRRHTGTVQASGDCVCRCAARSIRFALSPDIALEDMFLLSLQALFISTVPSSFPVAGVSAVDNGISTTLNPHRALEN